jgi:hypothetical protein
MTWYLYANADGWPDITQEPLDLRLFPGYVYAGEFRKPPDMRGKKYVSGTWVRGRPEPEYVEQRQAAYPSYGEQFDMLWHAMNSGQTPKVEPFYSQIKRIKDQFPKS